MFDSPQPPNRAICRSIRAGFATAGVMTVEQRQMKSIEPRIAEELA
jgi:hypothetical protein